MARVTKYEIENQFARLKKAMSYAGDPFADDLWLYRGPEAHTILAKEKNQWVMFSEERGTRHGVTYAASFSEICTKYIYEYKTPEVQQKIFQYLLMDTAN